jgi:hypothetical protein
MTSSQHTPPAGGNLIQAQQYFDWWFGPALSDPQFGDVDIVLATLSSAGSIAFRAFRAPLDAARWVVAESAHTNVFTHVALHSPDRPLGKGSDDSAVCLPGLAADLDAQSPFRASNEGKAPDVASLELVIADFEQNYQFPLTLVASGHGIFAHARFKEPLWLEDKRSRTEAGHLLARFAEGLRVFARQRGWPATVERVPLAGMTRAAGSWNRKGDPPRAVRFLDRNGAIS